MKKLLLLSSLVSLSLSAVGQQTFFSVPSSDITPKHKILAQQQVDINSEQLRFSTTVDYGLGRNWEVGLNLYNIDYQSQEHTWLRNDTTLQLPYAPLLLINAQRTFNLTDALHIGLGGQTGLNLFPNQSRSS
jgi:hypothetical protein